MKVLIVPDKFKGTLTAAEAAVGIARGWRKARPRDTLELLPMSDGGDGFGEVMSALLRARPQKVITVDAAHRPCTATWWREGKTKTAIIESAKVIGLAMLPPGKFHPFELDTFGLGAVLLAAQSKGARKFLIGIGGSATNDGGFGLARALGWNFFDRHGRLIERWTELHALVKIQPPKTRRIGKIVVAVDVQNPLLGSRGATRVYGPQKGIKPSEFAEAEKNLRRLALVSCSGGLRPPTPNRRSQSAATIPGAGAAGGLGFGLTAFLGAQPEGGFELFARHAKLGQRLRTADLVITGEGAIDRQTLMGKGVGQIARQCAALKIPCLGLAGWVAPEVRDSKLFLHAGALIDLTDVARAKAKPALWLERLATATALEFKL